MCFEGFLIIIIVGEISIQFKAQKEIHRWFLFKFSKSARSSWFSSVQTHVFVCDISSMIYISWFFYSNSFLQSLNTQLSDVERDLWVHKKVRKFIKRKTVPCGWVGKPPGTADWDECLPGQHSSHTVLRQRTTNCCYAVTVC